MNLTIFVPLLIAHVLGDFYLQNDKQCRNKDEKKFRSPYLYVHSLVIGLLPWPPNRYFVSKILTLPRRNMFWPEHSSVSE